MRDRAIIVWGLILLLFMSLACNAFAGRVEPSLPPPPNPTQPPDTNEPPDINEPTEPPELAPTVTLPGDSLPAAAQGTVRILVDLNIRSGPGVRFDRVGFLLKDERAEVIGRDPQSGWWQIQCPPAAEGTACWVSGGSQFTLLESGE